MKKSFFLLLFLSLCVFKSFSQDGKPGHDTTLIRICIPSRAEIMNSPKPLIVLKYGDNEFKFLARSIDNKTLSRLFNSNDIEKLDVLKDAKSTEIYGEDGKNGVIIITIKEEKIKEFEKELKKFKRDLKLLKNP